MSFDDPTGACCRNRLFEWTMAVALLGAALCLSIWPRSIGSGNFHLMLRVTGVSQLTLVYSVVAVTRMFALFMNGRLHSWGPPIRAMTALFSSMIWIQLSLALMLAVPAPSPSVAIYAALAVGELVSVWRAKRDSDGGDKRR